MTALLKLAERVEAGEATQVEVCGALGFDGETSNFNNPDHVRNFRHQRLVEVSLEGSLDAAKTLHDAVLPEELKPRICQTTVGWTVYMIVGHNGIVAAGKANHPAAAWIAATLRAKANDK